MLYRSSSQLLSSAAHQFLVRVTDTGTAAQRGRLCSVHPWSCADAIWPRSWAACLSGGAGAAASRGAFQPQPWVALGALGLKQSQKLDIPHQPTVSDIWPQCLHAQVFQMIGTVLIPWANGCRHFPERVPNSGLVLNQALPYPFKRRITWFMPPQELLRACTFLKPSPPDTSRLQLCNWVAVSHVSNSKKSAA